MVVSLDPSGLDHAAEWIARLDKTGAGERLLHVYPLQYGKAQTLARLLARLFSPTGGLAEGGNAALPPGTVGARISTAAVAGSGPSSAMAPGGGAPAAQAGAAAGGSFGGSDHSLTKPEESGADVEGSADGGKGPRIIADTITNSLLAMADAAEARRIEEALAKLDVRPTQVLIEATVAEVTLNKNLEYGVQYFLRGNPILRNPDSSVGFSTALSSGALHGLYPGFNAVLGTLSSPSVVLSALNAVTDVKVISSPQVVVTDSHEAMLKVGTQIPLLTQQAVSTQTAGAPVVSNVDYHDTGVILRVLPRANTTDTVSLDIAQEVSEVVPSAANPLTPNIQQRRIESTVAVDSGQTVMLGGLISENNSVTHSGIPELSSLPVVGALFGDQGTSHTRTELIVFVTPHVLRNGEDARRLTEDLMDRLKSLRPATP